MSSKRDLWKKQDLASEHLLCWEMGKVTTTMWSHQAFFSIPKLMSEIRPEALRVLENCGELDCERRWMMVLHVPNKKILGTSSCMSMVPDHVWLFYGPQGLPSTRLLCPWDFSSKNTGVGCHFLLGGLLPNSDQSVCINNNFSLFSQPKYLGNISPRTAVCLCSVSKCTVRL